MRYIFILLLLFTFTILGFSQSQRMVLVEHFTSSTCGPCGQQNPGFDALLGENEDIITSIKYHMNWPSPGNDPMYLDNPTDNNARRGYYNVNSVPFVQFDGDGWSGLPGNCSQAIINNAAAQPAVFNMSIQHELSANQDTVYVKALIEATDEVSGDLVCHLVVVEKMISFSTPPGTNGERNFPNVMKKLLPDQNGFNISDSWSSGQYVILESAWALENVYDVNEIAVIGFIQDNNSSEIHQAANSSTDALQGLYSNDAELLQVDQLTNPNCSGLLSPRLTIRNNGTNTLNTYQITYISAGGDAVTLDYETNLGFLEKESFIIEGIDFQPDMINTLELQISQVNGGTDPYTQNNESIQIIEPASELSQEVKLILYPDNKPNETSWELLNSNGEVIQSGGPYEDSGLKIITFDISDVGCYQFVMHDAGGDGICCEAGNGYYAVFVNQNNIVFEGSKFLDKKTGEFFYGTVGTAENIYDMDISLAPNPSSDISRLSFNLKQSSDVEIAIHNLTGQILWSRTYGSLIAGNQEIPIDLSELPGGLYLVRLQIGDNSIIKKINKQ